MDDETPIKPPPPAVPPPMPEDEPHEEDILDDSKALANDWRAVGDETPPAPAPAAPEEMTVGTYIEVNKLRRWQAALLRDRLGLGKSMPASEIAEQLDAFSKERI